jgi:hypothetical protein
MGSGEAPQKPPRAEPKQSSQGSTWPRVAPISQAAGLSVARIEIGTHVNYRGRLHVVVGVTPIGVQPRLLELEDVESGRIRQVNPSDPDLEVAPNSLPEPGEGAANEDLA